MKGPKKLPDLEALGRRLNKLGGRLVTDGQGLADRAAEWRPGLASSMGGGEGHGKGTHADPTALASSRPPDVVEDAWRSFLASAWGLVDAVADLERSVREFTPLTREQMAEDRKAASPFAYCIACGEAGQLRRGLCDPCRKWSDRHEVRTDPTSGKVATKAIGRRECLCHPAEEAS